jgi:hypothetical protein
MNRVALLRVIALVAAGALAATNAHGQSGGDITGRVIDESARPVAGARLELRPGARRAVSGDDGRFAFPSVAPGRYTLLTQRIGYRPLTTPIEVTAAGARPSVVLVAIPRVLDSVRIVERATPNRFTATVLDEAGVPVPDVAVTVEGVSNTLRTDSLGRFAVPGALHGSVVIRMRKMGYRAYLGSLRMIATRDDTLRMSRLAQSLSAVQITEASGFGRDTFVYKELDQRLHWKSHQAGVVSREELSAMGRMNLCTAFLFTPTGLRYGVTCARACVIVNGGGKTLMPPSAYYADQVEMVEYYPPGSDWSGSLAARGCGGRGPTLVIWRRTDAGAKH